MYRAPWGWHPSAVEYGGEFIDGVVSINDYYHNNSRDERIAYSSWDWPKLAVDYWGINDAVDGNMRRNVKAFDIESDPEDPLITVSGLNTVFETHRGIINVKDYMIKFRLDFDSGNPDPWIRLWAIEGKISVPNTDTEYHIAKSVDLNRYGVDCYYSGKDWNYFVNYVPEYEKVQLRMDVITNKQNLQYQSLMQNLNIYEFGEYQEETDGNIIYDKLIIDIIPPSSQFYDY
jgi:hypothetical protein